MKKLIFFEMVRCGIDSLFVEQCIPSIHSFSRFVEFFAVNLCLLRIYFWHLFFRDFGVLSNEMVKMRARAGEDECVKLRNEKSQIYVERNVVMLLHCH